jgi:hypothetical protein
MVAQKIKNASNIGDFSSKKMDSTSIISDFLRFYKSFFQMQYEIPSQTPIIEGREGRNVN